jgi:hypothetical protein
MAPAATLGRNSDNFGHGRAREVGEKKEEREGVRFHTLPAAEMHCRDRISRKMQGRVCSSVLAAGLHGGRQGAPAQGKGRDGGAGGARRRVGDALVVAAYITGAARAAGGWAGATRRPTRGARGGGCAGAHAKMVRCSRGSRGRLGPAIRGGDATAGHERCSTRLNRPRDIVLGSNSNEYRDAAAHQTGTRF